MSASARRTVVPVFLVLVVLTAAEIAAVKTPGLPRLPLISALVLLAVAKAALVLLYFMHLRRETWALKLTVIAPFSLPAAYAFALIFDVVWRIGR
jgi:caa(3)-type oxidase subunit IV